MRFKFFSFSRKTSQAQRDYETLLAPKGYKLTYSHPVTKTHGIAYSRFPDQILETRATLGDGYSWVLERGQEGAWEHLESFEPITKSEI